MQIVINIPEWKYKSICEGVEASKKCGVVGIDRTIHEAIYNGIILPKGHGRLKDIDTLESRIESVSYGYDWECGENLYTEEEIFLANDIWNAPTIIEADAEQEEQHE